MERLVGPLRAVVALPEPVPGEGRRDQRESEEGRRGTRYDAGGDRHPGADLERVYSKAEGVPRVLGGMGIAILSTNQGLMTDREARRRRVGGEILCQVW